jgi:hypothetical protein
MNTDQHIAGIPTLYRGVQYRSRLEAKWAAFFNEIGWWHTYEPFDAHGYIPDFMIQGARPFLVEVKPAVIFRDYHSTMQDILPKLEGIWQHDVLVTGVTPLPHIGDKFLGNAYPAAGLLGEHWPTQDGWDVDTGRWFHCLRCGTPCLMHSSQSWAGRPCGHDDGNTYIGPMSNEKIESAWSAAGNTVQWWKAE